MTAIKTFDIQCGVADIFHLTQPILLKRLSLRDIFPNCRFLIGLLNAQDFHSQQSALKSHMQYFCAKSWALQPEETVLCFSLKEVDLYTFLQLVFMSFLKPFFLP